MQLRLGDYCPVVLATVIAPFDSKHSNLPELDCSQYYLVDSRCAAKASTQGTYKHIAIRYGN